MTDDTPPALSFAEICAARWAEVERELATPRKRKARTHWHERWMEQTEAGDGYYGGDSYGK